MIRLIDEVVIQLAYLDTGNKEPEVDYVCLSFKALDKIKKELVLEMDKDFEKIMYEDVVKKLTIDYLVVPGSFGYIDYFFVKKVTA